MLHISELGFLSSQILLMNVVERCDFLLMLQPGRLQLLFQMGELLLHAFVLRPLHLQVGLQLPQLGEDRMQQLHFQLRAFLSEKIEVSVEARRDFRLLAEFRQPLQILPRRRMWRQRPVRPNNRGMEILEGAPKRTLWYGRAGRTSLRGLR